MGAYLVAPKSFTIVGLFPAGQNLANAASTLSDDRPGRVWQSVSGTTIAIDIQGDGSTIDALALIGTDLQAADTVSLRFATMQAGLDSATPTTIPAFAGTKVAPFSTKTVFRFTARAFQFVRVTMTLPTARTVTAQRLVIGQAVDMLGLSQGASITYEDPSIAIEGMGYTAYEAYPCVPVWKFSSDAISGDVYRTKFAPLFMTVGQSRGLLFVPEDSTNHQSEIIFGRITGKAEGTGRAFNWYAINMAIKALAP